jgi:tetratricopeptide (TPR) repeat protein
MATNKNLRWKQRRLMAALTFALVVVQGCSPPGPRALLAGKKLLDQGKAAAAVEKLQLATKLMATNAQAWNYLGLAYHDSRQPDKAIEAYQKSLKYNNNLAVVHFNLGCALLEVNKPDLARNELTAYTLKEGNSASGWIKLGSAQLRLREPVAAEKSFKEALQLSAENPEALNGLGLVEAQRNRPRDAAAMFNRAVEKQPNFGPALLNLAVVSQSLTGGKPVALQKYRAYLSLQPRPADWDSVNATARQLEQELNAAVRPTIATPTVAEGTAPQGRGSTATVARVAPPPTNTPRPEVASTPPPTNVAPLVQKPAMATVPEVPPERVVLPSEAAPGVAASNSRTAVPAVVLAANPGTTAEPEIVDANLAGQNSAEKPGFLQRINPFRRDTRPVGTPPPMTTVISTNPADLRPGSGMSTNGAVLSKTVPEPVGVTVNARYSYLSPEKPAPGNRAEAERQFALAIKAQNEHRQKEAAGYFRASAQADPGYFDAQANFALAQYNLGDLSLSLPAYETALAIDPTSFSTRFNFALALRKGGFNQDAAQELERLLVTARKDENSNHLAMAHLTLANLYSEQFHRPEYAKLHYWKVLELDSQNSQATAIRYWLRDNP